MDFSRFNIQHKVLTLYFFRTVVGFRGCHEMLTEHNATPQIDQIGGEFVPPPMSTASNGYNAADVA
jgi:hypothetical protein